MSHTELLLRHGTILHDKYLLPHFIWEDFKEVILDLNDTGYEFDPNWYKVFLDFRFPIFGTVQSGDIKLEIRMAIEPWLVLGEEGIQGGTARYVDSSLERVQVRVLGMTGKRHIITCNGRPVKFNLQGLMVSLWEESDIELGSLHLLYIQPFLFMHLLYLMLWILGITALLVDALTLLLIRVVAATLHSPVDSNEAES